MSTRTTFTWVTILVAAGLGVSIGLPEAPHLKPYRVPQIEVDVEKRAIATELSTCGYLNGDPKIIRTAEPGFNCRINTANGLWGFCTNTLAQASDCSMWGACVDSFACSSGCGFTGRTDIQTTTCPGALGSFCSTALLTFGVDQTYSYINCGATATVDHYLISPTLDTSTSKSTAGGEPSASETSSGGSASTSSTGIDSGSKSNTGAIIGGVIGGLALVGIIMLAAIYILRRNRRAARPWDPVQGAYEAQPLKAQEPSKPVHSGPPSELMAPYTGGQSDSPVELGS